LEPDRKRKIQQLPKGSLSNRAIPAMSAEQKAENEGNRRQAADAAKTAKNPQDHPTLATNPSVEKSGRPQDF
jgi:hypothetical protein